MAWFLAGMPEGVEYIGYLPWTLAIKVSSSLLHAGGCCECADLDGQPWHCWGTASAAFWQNCSR